MSQVDVTGTAMEDVTAGIKADVTAGVTAAYLSNSIFSCFYKVSTRLDHTDHLFDSAGNICGYHVLHKRECVRCCRPQYRLGGSLSQASGVQVRQQVDGFIDRTSQQVVLSVR